MSNRLVNKFMEIYAIIGVDRRVWKQNGKLVEVNAGKNGRQTGF
jgi:hypothetical protein